MLFAVLFTVAAIVAANVLWRRWKYDLHKIPATPGWPLLGHMPYIIKGQGEYEFSQFIGRSWRRLGHPRVFKFQVPGKTILCVRDIECVKTLVLSKTKPFPKSPSMIPVVAPLLGGDESIKPLLFTGVVTPYTKAVRRVYLDAMQSSNLKKSLPKVSGVLERMFEIVEDRRQKGPVDFQELCVRMTLDAIGAVAFGMPLGGLDGHQRIYDLLLAAGHVGQERRRDRLRTTLYKLLPFLEGAQKQRQVVEALAAEWKALTEEILSRDDPPKGEEPIWHGLRQLVNPETGESLTHSLLVAEVATVVLGGMDTTGHQLAYILALLADHPHVVDKLIEEFRQHGLHGMDGKELTLENLTDLPYLSAVIKEGMRLTYILNGVLNRTVPHDMKILGYRIPKGTIVHLPGMRWMNSVEDWGDPDVFRPERWLTDEDMSKKYIFPFSHGPRDCVGQKLAMMEMRLALVRLVQRYSLAPTRLFEDIIKDTQNGVAIESLKGISLHVTPRSEAPSA